MINNVIKMWLVNLFGERIFPSMLIDSDFLVEDGMSLIEYWDYEVNSAINFSGIFDLNSDLDFKIIKSFPLVGGKILHHIYVFNYLGKIAFKMNITTNKDFDRITSNNFNSQIVPKYEIHDSEIKNLKIAIKSPKIIKEILSPDFTLVSFNQGCSFEEDGFYHVEFLNTNQSLSNDVSLLLYLKYDDGLFEKRYVYFDTPQLSNIPYLLEGETLTLIDSSYPVSISIFNLDGSTITLPYPRNFSLNTNKAHKVIVTDVLDNDWIISF